ncbi:unnamed protein product [Hymenolepis diminuta]|uniref:Uncharacterized protein n=1 Tax=Hymenolepis diminuta TaxID=6216 RepID=A0A564XZN5_HYMDI|nr:unnamed protein product [Hymenolepis diminuta]
MAHQNWTSPNAFNLQNTSNRICTRETERSSQNPPYIQKLDFSLLSRFSEFNFIPALEAEIKYSEVLKRVTDFQKDALKNEFNLIKETLDMYQDLLIELQTAQNALYRIPAELQNDNLLLYSEQTISNLRNENNEISEDLDFDGFESFMYISFE